MSKRWVISSELKDKYVKHLGETAKDAICPWCGENQWKPSDHYVAPLILTPFWEATLNNVPLIPLMLSTCLNCGNTMFFNGVVAKVFEEPILGNTP